MRFRFRKSEPRTKTDAGYPILTTDMNIQYSTWTRITHTRYQRPISDTVLNNQYSIPISKIDTGYPVPSTDIYTESVISPDTRFDSIKNQIRYQKLKQTSNWYRIRYHQLWAQTMPKRNQSPIPMPKRIDTKNVNRYRVLDTKIELQGKGKLKKEGGNESH